LWHVSQGIYRVPGQKSKTLKLFADAIEKGRPVNLQDVGIATCASTLKHYLRVMDPPLLTFSLCDQFASAAGEHKAPIGTYLGLSRVCHGLSRLVNACQALSTRVNIDVCCTVVSSNLLWCVGRSEGQVVLALKRVTQLLPGNHYQVAVMLFSHLAKVGMSPTFATALPSLAVACMTTSWLLCS
jgi:hypothetical protein